MPLGLQAKLLRVLQEREVERVGARKPITWISACWPPVTAIWRRKWRRGASVKTFTIGLSVFPLAWRPLRERPADIVPLAERLLAKYVKKMNHAPIRFLRRRRRA